MDRRRFLHLLSTSALAMSSQAFAGIHSAQAGSARNKSDPVKPANPPLETILDELQFRTCRYFYEQASAQTGIARDRSKADGDDHRRIGSIAATGFALSALCIAAARGYLKESAAEERALATLAFFARKAQHERGFFYHFIDIESAGRLWKCELSSVDTAWLLCGVIHCREYFHQPQITNLADEILNRVDWKWMLDGGRTLSHGWKPESGFLPYRWDSYSEHMAMYLLAISSPTHPIPPACWEKWSRPEFKYDEFRFISANAPLFIHQYSHAWFDFRHVRDQHANYFENSRIATQAHKSFCLKLHQKYPWITETLWGITSSDSRHGYVAWGGPPKMGPIDGTIVPCAAAGSLVFLPEECGQVISAISNEYGSKVLKKYGFADAFHPGSGWVNEDVIGIDLGITLLMAENFRSQSVWKQFMRSSEAKRGFELAGLVEQK
jgi:hypothetical protein